MSFSQPDLDNFSFSPISSISFWSVAAVDYGERNDLHKSFVHLITFKTLWRYFFPSLLISALQWTSWITCFSSSLGTLWFTLVVFHFRSNTYFTQVARVYVWTGLTAVYQNTSLVGSSSLVTHCWSHNPAVHCPRPTTYLLDHQHLLGWEESVDWQWIFLCSCRLPLLPSWQPPTLYVTADTQPGSHLLE